MTIISLVNFVDLGLRTTIFQEADRNYYPVALDVREGKEINLEEQQKQMELEQVSRRQRELSNSIALILVGTPLFLYHWRTVQKEAKKK